MKKKLRLIGRLYLFVFAVWGLYRLIFRLPEEIEEVVLKPIVWLGPTLYIVFGIEKRGLPSLGYSLKTFWSSVSKGLVFGLLFLVGGLSLGFLQGKSIRWENFFQPGVLGVCLVTAISEETVFRGYILNRLEEVLGEGAWVANIIASFGFALIHIPVSIFVYHYALPQLFLYLMVIFLASLGSGFIFSWSKGIWGSILVHVLLAWPVMLV